MKKQFIIQGPLQSVNGLYKTVRNNRGAGTRRVKTAAGKNFAERVALTYQIACGPKKFIGPIIVYISYTFPDNRRRDVTNYDKAILDALAGIAYDDDSQITIFIATKKITKTHYSAKIIIGNYTGYGNIILGPINKLVE